MERLKKLVAERMEEREEIYVIDDSPISMEAKPYSPEHRRLYPYLYDSFGNYLPDDEGSE